jgi:hypothetical protein
MFRIRAPLGKYKDFFRNIYKSQRHFILGVAELEYEILFFTLQLPLSSLLLEGFLIILGNKKHTMVFKTIGYLR